MGDSVALRIEKDYETRLGEAGKPADARIHRNRHLPIEQDELPSIVVYTILEEVSRSNLAGDTDRWLTILAECRAKGDPPQDALDPLKTWALKAAMSDPTWGGLAKETVEFRAEWGAESRTVVLGRVFVGFRVHYETPGDDPETAR